MAKPRIFVSSTCYDLGTIRSELRPFISQLGYEPVMSDYSDILYDPRSHTHDSCIKEVPNCDMVVLIIGQRFGGTGVPSVIEDFDFSALETTSSKTELLRDKKNLSITQLEVLKAITESIPVYVFVDNGVLHDHHVYEKNKNNDKVISEIEFPSIQKRETAKYIFEFINFLSHRAKGNGVTGFSRLEDIRSHLLSQWAQMFQRLLYEDKAREFDTRRYRDFSERLEDLKAVVLASITAPNLRETARGAVKYRHLLHFISGLNIENHSDVLIQDISFDELLNQANIVEIREDISDQDTSYRRSPVYLLVSDGTFYRCRGSAQFIENVKLDWNLFVKLDRDSKLAISGALLEDADSRRFSALRYVPRQFDEYIEEQNQQRIINLDSEEN